MATLTQIVQYTLPILNEPTEQFGDKNSPDSLTVNGQIYDTGNVPVAENFGTALLWSNGNGGLNTFSYLLFRSTADVYLEFANLVPNPDERSIVFVPANTTLVIPGGVMGGYASNSTRLNGTQIVSGTAFNSIQEIRVQRNVATGGGGATCRLMLIL